MRSLVVLTLSLLASTAWAGSKRYIVQFKDAPAARALLRGTEGASIKLELLRHKAMAAEIPERALQRLRQNPNIVSIEEDPVRELFAERSPYGISYVQADALVQQVSPPSGGVTACIIDSGYFPHEDLPTPVGGASEGAGPFNQDGCAHGTHVAGTIAALGNNGIGVVGVNPNDNVNIFVVRLFDDQCRFSYASSLIGALDACEDAGATVVNMSLGGGGSSDTEQQAFADAYSRGVLSIAAAGNGGNSALSYPASYSSVVSVAAIDENYARADFSQFNSQVEIAAPGVAVESTVPYGNIDELTVGGQDYDAASLEFSPTTGSGGVTGPLANGGLCNSVGSWAGRVVLCERGEITYADKVDNVQAGGGIAAVVYNNEPGALTGVTLGSDDPRRTIPALTIAQADGQALAATGIGSSATVVVEFTTGVSGYDLENGTSMASPHVAGVAALVWSYFPTASAADLRAALTATALDLGATGRDNEFGHGLVQAVEAYNFLAAGNGADDGPGDGDDDDGGNACFEPGVSCSSSAQCCSGWCSRFRGTCF